MMRRIRYLGGLALWVLAFAVSAPVARAHLVEDNASWGPFTFYVNANITAPSQNAVFHTGGAGSMNVDCNSSHVARVTPNGQQQATTFNLYHELSASWQSELLAADSSQQTAPEGSTQELTFSKSFNTSPSVPAGGRTVNATSAILGELTTTDQHSFSVINP